MSIITDVLVNIGSDFLSDRFKDFNDNYKRYSIISENPEKFSDELEDYLLILKNRISREENEIYSLL